MIWQNPSPEARGDDIILEREENVFISNRDGLLL